MVWIKRVILLSLTILSPYLILKYVNTVPFFFLALALTIIFILATILTKSATYKAVFWNLAFVMMLMGFGEAYYAGWDLLGLNHAKQTSYPYLNPSDLNNITGYSGRKCARAREKELYGSEVVYDVTYSTNKFGLRITPHDINPVPNPDYKNAVFFGCSFTFGTGLNDNETLPYLFEEESGGRYRAYNFGYGGYGPHQMLRILETGWLDTVITDKKPAIAVCMALIDHVDRSSGKYPTFLWGPYGPQYRVDSFGRVQYAGQFLDTAWARIKYRIYQQLAKSYLIRETYVFRKALGWTRTDADRDLFIKILVQSKEVFTEKYQGDFLVIFRGYKGDQDSDYVVAELRRRQVNVVTADEIFQRFKDPPERYAIEHDGHPTRLYNQRVAEYLLARFGNH